VTTRQAAILARATLATLVRTVPVRVLDVSSAGCRIESRRWLTAGTVGRLHVSLQGQGHEDDVRIARCQVRQGAGRSYLAGAELLGTRRLNGRTIRLAIQELVQELEAGDCPPPEGTSRALPDRESEHQAKGVSRAPPVPSGVKN
jgi:hypothetical protein